MTRCESYRDATTGARLLEVVELCPRVSLVNERREPRERGVIRMQTKACIGVGMAIRANVIGEMNMLRGMAADRE